MNSQVLGHIYLYKHVMEYIYALTSMILEESPAVKIPVIQGSGKSLLVYRNPKRLIDPFDGVLHVLVPIIAIPLCWCYL